MELVKVTITRRFMLSLFLFIFQNNLGILWSEREEIETAQAYLDSSEALYLRYMKEVCCMSDKF